MRLTSDSNVNVAWEQRQADLDSYDYLIEAMLGEQAEREWTEYALFEHQVWHAKADPTPFMRPFPRNTVKR